jgi:hypothetical protein
MCLLVDLASAQDDVEEQYADIDSEEELEDTTLQDPSSAEEENEEDFECHLKLSSDKADVHQFVGEQNGLNKAAAPSITENSQPCELFLLYFQTNVAVIVQETN